MKWYLQPLFSSPELVKRIMSPCVSHGASYVCGKQYRNEHLQHTAHDVFEHVITLHRHTKSFDLRTLSVGLNNINAALYVTLFFISVFLYFFRLKCIRNVYDFRQICIRDVDCDITCFHI